MVIKLKRKIETVLWKIGLISDDYIFLRNIRFLDEKEETWCKQYWDTRAVHNDMSSKMFLAYYKDINNNLNFKENDKILSIGCGDGILDKVIYKQSNATIYGFDFSLKKIEEAKKNNTMGIYWVQSFIEDINVNKYDINKIYSFSVMQYCKPENLEIFFQRQLEFAVKQKHNEIIIFHGDIPDKDLSYNYYYMFKREVVEKYKDNLNLIFNENSYWHDMNFAKKIIESICDRLKLKCMIYITPSSCLYRSNIKIIIKK